MKSFEIILLIAGILVILLILIWFLKHASYMCKRLNQCGSIFAITMATPLMSAAGATTSHQSTTTDMASIRIDPSLCATMNTWYELIAGAERDIWIAQYSWRFSFREGSRRRIVPHNWYIGLALKHNQQLNPERRLRFKAVINSFVAIGGNHQLNQTIRKLLGLWQYIGVDIERIDWLWVRWSHKRAANIHAKLLMVDERLVNISTSNVSINPHNGNHCWGQSGITIDSPVITAQTISYMKQIESAPEATTIHSEKITPFDVRRFGESVNLDSHTPDYRNQTTWQQLEQSLLTNNSQSVTSSPSPPSMSWIQVPTSKIQIIGQMPRASLWETRGAECLQEIVRLIDSAKTSIDIMTPNFNDPCIWKSVVRACERGVDVRIICGIVYNASYDPLINYSLGYRSNIDMKRKIIDRETQINPFIRKHLSWRWYGKNGHALYDQNTGSGHHKLMIIDQRHIAIGSFNCDVFSTLNSGEVIALVDSVDVSQNLSMHLVEPQWQQHSAKE